MYLFIVRQVLKSVGFPKATVNLFLAQAAFECGSKHFSSGVAQNDNNLSGIYFINNSTLQKNATKGSARPPSEGGNYAHFTSILDWAIDFKRILSLRTRPIDAKTAKDLARRLKENHYYASDEADYEAGIESYYKEIDGYLI